MIQMFVNDPVACTQYDLSSLKRILYAGSPITEALLERAIELFPNVDFFQAYGLTESSGTVSVLTPEYHRPETRHLGKLRSAGQANHVSTLKIVDPQGNEVPRGQVGEIAIKAPMVMLGYWGKPQESAAALRDGWLMT